MYFYIVEALRNKSIVSNLSKFKDELRRQGIAGEVIATNPLRPNEELCELGIQKGYSTIVAVGDDTHVNEIAGMLLGSNTALGVVPVQASSGLLKLLDVNSFKKALIALRFRKIREVTMSEIMGKAKFLTHARLHSRLPTLFNIYFEKFLVVSQTREVIVANINPITGQSEKGKVILLVKGLKQSKGLLGKIFVPADTTFGTEISIPVLKVETKDPFSVSVGDIEVAETPAVFRALQKPLRLIVSKKDSPEDAQDTKHQISNPK